jgi:hypothetical protein
METDVIKVGRPTLPQALKKFPVGVVVVDFRSRLLAFHGHGLS